MTMHWFRMYSEFATDPKVQMMSESDQRRFVMLLCLRCSNGDVTLHDDEVAFQLRVTKDEWERTKAIFRQKNLIDDHNNPTAWDRRQFSSDSSAARVAAHRERKKQACNVTVTPPDTDTDTDTEIKRAKALMSGSDEKSPASDASKEVLDYMNERSGKRFKPTKSNLSLIKARLSEHSQTELCGVIDRKVQEWAGTEFEQYIRPATVFGAQKCSQYVGELGQPIRRKTNGKRPCTFESQGIEIPKF